MSTSVAERIIKTAGMIFFSMAAMMPVAKADWVTAGANAQRTSWVSEEVRGGVSPVWYRPIEPYISQNVQIVAAEGKVFISTARGLYALNAATGQTEWVYATEIPLGHSPTYDNGVLYVGGFDRRLHAIDAATGARLWTFDEANAGYRTSPLVADGLVMLGNRDGWFYAVKAVGDPNAGKLAWKYQTGGPINYSAAYKDGVVFFASMDMHCYALYAASGTSKWVSPKLHGQGFQSWWPVIYRNRVVLTTRPNYREYQRPGSASCGVYHYASEYDELDTELVNGVERDELFPSGSGWIGAQGNEPGDWAAGTSTLDVAAAVNYFNSKPWRRNRYFLDIETGADMEVAPILFVATKNGVVSGPPMVSGYDDVIYMPTSYRGDLWICRGGYAGWKIGTPFISRAGGEGAVDEPRIASGGGAIMYESICCDREGRGRDLANPGGGWTYWSYNFGVRCPGYDEMWFGVGDQDGTGNRLYGYYGSLNGIYHNHTGDQNPLIPYNGRLYIHRSNAVVCWAPGGSGGKVPLAPIVTPPAESQRVFTTTELKQMLADEIQKWLDAGHLHPGWFNGGQLCVRNWGAPLNSYFHCPGDDLWVLLRSLPYLPAAMQTQLRAFIQGEYAAYSPATVTDIGWKSGATRDWFIYPPEVVTDMQNYDKSTSSTAANRNIYALWKYAQEFGGASTIYNGIKNRLPAASYDNSYAYRINESIAGHWAYLELERMAGQPETASIRTALNNMLSYRVNNFTIDSPFADPDGGGAAIEGHLNTSRNFIYLTPELGQYLYDHIEATIQAAIQEYNYVQPYWFVSRYEGSTQENTIHNLHQYYAFFQAKAWALKQSRQELLKYLDVPGFMRGDVYYIHNLISAIEAEGAPPTMTPAGGGTYVNPVTVTLSTADPCETVYYTTNGSDPDETSTRYSTPFVLSASATVKGRAYRDGHASSIASAVFTIDTGLANLAPLVNAGADAEITMPANTVSLDGSVTDGTLPWPPGVVTTTWEKISGTGTVTFEDAESIDTTATFSTYSTYVLRLTAFDGELYNSDDVTIIVNPKPNEAPTVDAGRDIAVILPANTLALDATVTDDALPDPPAAVSTTWSKISGPGAVFFANAHAVDTTVTFSCRGQYVLRLQADDGQYLISDSITVTIHPEGYVGPLACYQLEGNGADGSGYGFHGTQGGTPTYEPGAIGQAIALDGVEDYVELPALNLNSNAVTISAWIKRNGSQNNYVGIIFTRAGSSVAGINFRTNNELGYHWNDQSWDWASGIFVPDGQWVFIAVVVEPARATLYMGTNGVLTSAVHSISHAIEEFNGVANIGRDPHQTSRYVKGSVDGVRIYKRALSQSEIQILANLDKPGDPNLTGDGQVNYYDLDALAEKWLWAGDAGRTPEDLIKDGSVDLLDFAEMANQWLE